MAATALSRYPGKVVSQVLRPRKIKRPSERRRLPEITVSDLDKLFDQARRLEPGPKRQNPSRKNTKTRH